MVQSQPNLAGNTSSQPSLSDVIHYPTYSGFEVNNFNLSPMWVYIHYTNISVKYKNFIGNSEQMSATTRLQSCKSNKNNVSPSVKAGCNHSNVTYQTGFSCSRLIAKSAEDNTQNGEDAGSVEITPSIFAVGLYSVCV